MSFLVNCFFVYPNLVSALRPGPRVRSYGADNRSLKVLGVNTCKVSHRGKVFIMDIVVVDVPGQPPIQVLPSCELLNLIQRVDAVKSSALPRHTLSDILTCPPIVKELADVFNGLGKIAMKHEIKLVPNHNPVVSAAARLPFKLQEKVYKKLDEMVADGVLLRISERTEWVSRIIVTTKPDGDIRICIDLSQLKKAVQR